MIIAVANHKGGPAKTTTAYHLAKAMTEAGYKVRLIDLDPQANLTTKCGGLITAGEIGDALGGAVNPTRQIRQIAQTMDDGTQLVPASIQLENVASGLMTRPTGRLTALRKALSGCADDVDFHIIDCPPNAGVLTLNALVAADWVVIPSEAEDSSINGVRTILQLTEDVLEVSGAHPRVAGILATRVEMHTTRHQIGVDILKKMTPPFLGIIPKRSGVSANIELSFAYSALLPTLLEAMEVSDAIAADQ